MPDLQRFSFPYHSMNPLLEANTHIHHQSAAPSHPDSPSGLLPDTLLGGPDAASFLCWGIIRGLIIWGLTSPHPPLTSITTACTITARHRTPPPPWRSETTWAPTSAS
ncbi:Glutamyl-tRNA reductase [Dissostichus eleginoides]|uniref:Glutamyl-tRNA reductase n=1 Tax=Dissostichus eleginoides TaxID=100907 RepID=A0AAD9C4B5_DISEL|nr:Glutamyl-tRNA reductase [Dissostichus eleginoides]